MLPVWISPPLSRLLTLLLLTFPVSCAQADWRLVPEASSLGFVSVKNGRVAEGHRFAGLTGQVSVAGAELRVDLASVDTLIPIRDERMRELLFEVARFPTAIFRCALDAAVIEAIAVGSSTHLEVVGELELHGVRQPLAALVLVTRVAVDRVGVTATRPVVVNAEAFALAAGIERLREIAGLELIAAMVPVSFALSFQAE